LNKIYIRILKIIGTLLTISVLYSIYIFFTTANPKDVDIINTDIRVLKKLDSLSTDITKEQLLEHNKIIIATLQERESTAYSLRMARESNVKQTRTIYIAILVVLLSLLFTKKKEDLELSIKLILILCTILVFYLVEVHSEDLLHRQDNSVLIIARSIEDIVNSTSINSFWYTLDYSNYLSQIYEATNGSFIRKLIKSAHPDIEQVGIYILPFLLICIWLIKNSFGKKRIN